MGEWKEISLGVFFTNSYAGEWGKDFDGINRVEVLRSTNFTDKGVLDLSNVAIRSVPPSILRKKSASKNDILFEKSGGSTDKAAGRVIFVENNFWGTASNFIEIAKVNPDFNPKFCFYLFYFLYNSGRVLKYQQQTTGIINFKLKEYLLEENAKIPTSLAEQTRIAQILSKVDEAIAHTEALIAKYQRIKTGLMQDLLTRGIDENGNIRSEETHAFKDSPLGRIPVEWEVSTLKEICSRIQDGTHFSPKTDQNGRFMYITSKNIRMGYLSLENVDYVNLKEHNKIYNRCDVIQGDVLLTKDGASTGNVSINTIKEPISLLSSVAFLRGKIGVLDNDFLLQVLSSKEFQKIMKDQMSGNAITRITLNKINNILLKLPPISEQIVIIKKLNGLDVTLKDNHNELAKLQSLKRGLMQDLLSGPREAVEKQ